jgi:ABC-type antimicrobial peptide transport system permease subunit
MGVDGDPHEIPGVLTLERGSWLRRGDEVVLGPKLARQKGLGPGDVLRLNGRDFTVVGIGKLRGFGFNLDSVAYLEIEAFRARVDVGDVFSMIAIDTADPQATAQGVLSSGSLSAFTRADLRRQAEKALETDEVGHWTLISLTLAIAGLFVSSMLGGAVAARRLEFATLRAIGVPARTILLAVAGEALAICLAGGAVGAVIATALGALLNGYYAPAFGFELLYAADAPLVAFMFGLALGLGLLAGFFPARDATRVDPVQVLREA